MPSFLGGGGGGEDFKEGGGVRANREGASLSLRSILFLLLSSLFTPEISIRRDHNHNVTVVRLCL